MTLQAKFIWMTMILFLSFSLAADPCHATDTSKAGVFIDGQLISEAIPIFSNETVYLPAKLLMEKLHAVIIPSKTPGNFAIRKGALYTQLTINEPKATINGIAKTISLPPQEIKGTIYLPLPLLLQATAFDGTADFDSELTRVMLNSPGYSAMNNDNEGTMAIVSGGTPSKSSKADYHIQSAKLSQSQYHFGDAVYLNVVLGKFSQPSTIKVQLWYTTNILTGTYDEGGVMQLKRTKVDYVAPSASGSLKVLSFIPPQPGNYKIRLTSGKGENYQDFNFLVDFAKADFTIKQMIISDSATLKTTDKEQAPCEPYVFKSGSNVYCHVLFSKTPPNGSKIKVIWARYSGSSEGRTLYYQQIFLGDGKSDRGVYALTQAKGLLSIDQGKQTKASGREGTWLVEIQGGSISNLDNTHSLRQFKIGGAGYPTYGIPEDI